MRRMMNKELTDVNRKRFNRIRFSIGMNKNLGLITVMPHAMRRMRASLIDRCTNNPRAVQALPFIRNAKVQFDIPVSKSTTRSYLLANGRRGTPFSAV
jgi:hypothetical protein